MIKYLLLLITASTLIGCGYKGDLYLPEPKKAEPIVVTPSTTTSTTETNNNDTPKVKRIIPE